MKTNLYASMCLALLLLTTAIGTALAQTVAAGVSQGDHFDYTYSVVWESTDPTATMPAEYIDLNNIQWIRISITNVSMSWISMDVTWHFQNGTENTQNGNINIDLQVINVPYGFLLVRAGADIGEKLYPSGGHSVVSDTQLRTYSFGQIETNHVLGETNDEGVYGKTEIFYNKATGVATEYTQEHRDPSGSYQVHTIETLKLESGTITASPTPLELPLYIVVPIVIIIIAALIVFAMRRRRKPSAPKTEQVEAEKAEPQPYKDSDDTDEEKEDETGEEEERDNRFEKRW